MEAWREGIATSRKQAEAAYEAGQNNPPANQPRRGA